ncbi:MAG: alpha-glucan family phosphorylase [Bacteroidota bacterium]
MIDNLKDNQIRLKRIFITAQLPKQLEPLEELSNNLWWSWNKEAIELFESVDPSNWIKSRYNPVKILHDLSVERAQELAKDKAFITRLKNVYADFKAYMKEKPKKKTPEIAYFSMEYGLHISLRLYSGGLGVLAGDFLKEASDSNVDMKAIGLLYRFGYFQQGLSLNGDQINHYPPQKFTDLPVRPVKDEQGEWLKIRVGIKGRLVFAKIWELHIGRISLYLLDTDLDENSWEDRSLTHQLYGGDNEHRLKQEILLGIGGTRALEALGIQADIYHCNEGHAAFMGLERLRNYIQSGELDFYEALEVVRSSNLFTTHTPVPAGHDYFSEGLLRNYLYNYAHDLGISWEQFIALGKINPDNIHELFSMSHLAIRLSQEVNGVSELHGAVSREMFNVLYPGYNTEEVHIGHVTNSVHYPTWIAKEWHDLYSNNFGADFLYDQSNKDYWRKIQGVDGAQIMELRQLMKNRLLDYVRKTMRADLTARGESPRAIFDVINKIDERALVIGFARRFATYKRAHLLFSNLERLDEIVNNPDQPVIFIFSGKAHPADQGGQDLIRQIIQISKQPRFVGKVIFLENYNMEMAKFLVQGVDIWLNTPTRPKEASGTSGMKAALNGVMNFSVLDGWWAEGYRPDAGWALSKEKTYQDQHLQNQLDAEQIYTIIQTDIAPKFFDRDENGLPQQWIAYIKTIIAEVAPYFTMKRMMDDYLERFYSKLAARTKVLQAKKFAKAKKVAHWKQDMRQAWDSISLVQLDAFDSENNALALGDRFNAVVKLDLGNMEAENLGVEVVFFRKINDDAGLVVELAHELDLNSQKGPVATYEADLTPNISGVFEYGFRVFPKHALLAHRQDLNLVKWLA